VKDYWCGIPQGIFSLRLNSHLTYKQMRHHCVCI